MSKKQIKHGGVLYKPVCLFVPTQAICPFTYLCSYAVSKPTRAQIYTVLFNVFLGQMLMIAQVCVYKI